MPSIVQVIVWFVWLVVFILSFVIMLHADCLIRLTVCMYCVLCVNYGRGPKHRAQKACAKSTSKRCSAAVKSKGFGEARADAWRCWEENPWKVQWTQQMHTCNDQTGRQHMCLIASDSIWNVARLYVGCGAWRAWVLVVMCLSHCSGE